MNYDTALEDWNRAKKLEDAAKAELKEAEAFYLKCQDASRAAWLVLQDMQREKRKSWFRGLRDI